MNIDQLTRVQEVLEHTYSRYNIKQFLRDCFKPLVLKHINANVDPDNPDIKLACDILGVLSQYESIYLHNLIEILYKSNNLEKSAIQISQLVLDISQAELLKIIPTKWGIKVLRQYTLSDPNQRILDTKMYSLPMVIPPLEVGINNNRSHININRGSGYLLDQKDSLILGGNYHTKDIYAQFLNKTNQIPFSLNTEVFSSYSYHNKSLDKKPNETELEYQSRTKDTRKFIQQTETIMSVFSEHGNKFWFTNKYDKRGRVYCQGYNLTVQGNTFQKAVLEFANKELIDDTASNFI